MVLLLILALKVILILVQSLSVILVLLSVLSILLICSQLQTGRFLPNKFDVSRSKSPRLRAFFFLPSEAGKPIHLKESGITPTKGKIIRMARASLANGGV